jgi:hypothetical protein
VQRAHDSGKSVFSVFIPSFRLHFIFFLNFHSFVLFDGFTRLKFSFGIEADKTGGEMSGKRIELLKAEMD